MGQRSPAVSQCNEANPLIDRISLRPWGKLRFGFIETQAGECLSHAMID
jgi:hypothetical protein